MKTQDQKIGLFASIVIQTNAMIGAGIVAIPALLVHSIGGAGLIVYLCCALLIGCIAYSFGELSLLHQGKGWCYHFPKRWGGHVVGVGASFCYVLGVLIAMGFVLREGGVWLHELFPKVSAQGLSVIILALLGGLVCSGRNASTLWQYLISALIFLGLLVTSGFALFEVKWERLHQVPFEGVWPLLKMAPVLLFSLIGLECVTSLYSIVRNPRKTVFRAALWGVGIVATIYILFTGAMMGAIPTENFCKQGEASLAKVFAHTFPQWKLLAQGIMIGGLCAILGTLHSMIWSVGVLILDVVKLSKSRIITTERGGTLLACLVILLSFLTFRSHALLNLTVLFISATYLLSIIALLREPQLARYRKLIAGIGALGALLMILFALFALIES